jgi:hypothetical protein
VSQGSAIALDYSKLAAIFIRIWSGPVHELNRTSIDKLQQPVFGFVSSSLFSSASWTADLRRVDVGKPNLYSVVADRVAVDHAVFLEGRTAEPEATSATWITASTRVERA